MTDIIGKIAFWVVMAVLVAALVHIVTALRIRVDGQQCQEITLRPMFVTECRL